MRDVKALKHVLRLLREERGFSQVQVAEALGVDSSVISGWESGDRKPPVERIFQLADLLDLDLGDLDYALELAGGAPRRPPARAVAPQPSAEELAARLLGGAEPELPVEAGEAVLVKLLEVAVDLAAELRRRRDAAPS